MQAQPSALPLNADPDVFINRPLNVAVAKLAADIATCSARPSFLLAFDVCDSARSLFTAYLVEWALNGAVGYRQRVVELMQRAQPVLERSLVNEQQTNGANLSYLETYVAHNLQRIDVLEVLHTKGREAAEEVLLCGHHN